MGSFLKLYQHFFFQTPEAGLNGPISQDISSFLISNTKVWLNLVPFFIYINIFNFNHQRLTLIGHIPTFLFSFLPSWGWDKLVHVIGYTTFLFSNTWGWLKSVYFWRYITIFSNTRGWLKWVHFISYINISFFKHQRLKWAYFLRYINISCLKHQRQT